MSEEANPSENQDAWDDVDARIVADDDMPSFTSGSSIESPPTPKRPAGKVLLSPLPISTPSPKPTSRSRSAGEVIMGFQPNCRPQKGDREIEAEEVFNSLDNKSDQFVFTGDGASDAVKHFFPEEINVNETMKPNNDQVDANPNAGGGVEPPESIDQLGITTLQAQDNSARREKRENEYRYKMDHPERGCFIIFNQEDFDIYNEGRAKSHHLSYRTGSSKDAANLYNMAQQLGFEYVRIIKDSTEKEIMQWIASLSEANHSNYDCFACAILTHGGDRDSLYVRDKKIKLSDFTRPFGADLCPSLALKPKLFFIQACRGTKTDPGAKVMLASFQADQVDAAGGMDTVDGGQKIITIPAEADYLIANSTVPEYYSFRNQSNGSIFIQNVCAVFHSFGDSLELMQLMTRVNRMTAYDFESNTSTKGFHEKKQIPSIATRLTAELYFTPKRIYQESSAIENESEMVVDSAVSIRTESTVVSSKSEGTRVESTMFEMQSQESVEYSTSASSSQPQYRNSHKSFYPSPITTRKKQESLAPPAKQMSSQQGNSSHLMLPSDATSFQSGGSASIAAPYRQRSKSAGRSSVNPRTQMGAANPSGRTGGFHKSSTESGSLSYMRMEPGDRNIYQRHSSPENRQLVTQQSSDMIMVGGKKTKKIYVETNI